jgi:hypothetical protein
MVEFHAERAADV